MSKRTGVAPKPPFSGCSDIVACEKLLLLQEYGVTTELWTRRSRKKADNLPKASNYIYSANSKPLVRI